LLFGAAADVSIAARLCLVWTGPSLETETAAGAGEGAEAVEKAEAGETVDVDAILGEWDQARDAEEKAADEGDGEGKPNLDEMLNVQKTALTEQRAEEDAFFDDLITRLKERQVFVIDDIRSDQSEQYVMIKILDRIKDNL
jgi:hypothetical protein